MVAELRLKYRVLKAGIRNLWRWLPVIWDDRDWDQTYLYTLIEAKLRFMAADTKKWHVARADKSAEQMLLCAALIRRLRNDDYWQADGSWDYKYAEVMAEQDRTLLFATMKKHIETWWD